MYLLHLELFLNQAWILSIRFFCHLSFMSSSKFLPVRTIGNGLEFSLSSRVWFQSLTDSIKYQILQAYFL